MLVQVTVDGWADWLGVRHIFQETLMDEFKKASNERRASQMLKASTASAPREPRESET